MSANSPQRNLRSSTKDIKRRKSIHENDPNIREKSPFPQHQKEYSKSPVRRKNDLNRNMKHSSNESDDNSDIDNENVEEESFEERSGHSSVNVSSGSKKRDYTPIALISIFVILVAALLMLALGQENKQKPFQSNAEIDCSEFKYLKAKHHQQNPKIFNGLKVLIEQIFRDRKSSKAVVFTFFSTDQSILDVLMKDIVHVTQKCIKQSNGPINLTHSDLNREIFLKDYTKIIGEYKAELEKRTILVINNLDELSSKIVPSLHSFTDTYNPLVKKSIIYLSIRVPQKPTNHADYIFTHLQHKWNDLSSNIRDPLITRLLDQAFFLEPNN